jgi:hypothetical protein
LSYKRLALTPARGRGWWAGVFVGAVRGVAWMGAGLDLAMERTDRVRGDVSGQ